MSLIHFLGPDGAPVPVTWGPETGTVADVVAALIAAGLMAAE